MLGPNRLDAFVDDVGEADARAEGDRGQDRHLRGGVRARDVLARIGLCVAEALRLGDRVRVSRAGLHPREDEIRRAVHDPEHVVDVVHHERLAQNLDHGNGGADAGFEAKLHSRFPRPCGRARPSTGDQLLVGGDNRLAGPKELQDVLSRWVDASHHLGDECDCGIAHDLLEVRRARRRQGVRPLEGRVANESAHDPKPVSRRPLDVVAVLLEQLSDSRADGAVAEQCHRDVDGSHAVRCRRWEADVTLDSPFERRLGEEAVASRRTASSRRPTG